MAFKMGLHDEDVRSYKDPAGSPVLILEAMSGLMGSMEEAKDRAQKKRVDEQSYYDTLRSHGYTPDQAMQIIDTDKTFKDIGEPADPRFKETQDLEMRKARAEAEGAEVGIQTKKQAIAESKVGMREKLEDMESRSTMRPLEEKAKKLAITKAEQDLAAAPAEASLSRRQTMLENKTKQLDILKKEHELSVLRSGEEDLETRKKKAEIEKAEIEVARLRKEQEQNFQTPETDQEKTAARSKSAAIQVIKMGKYRDDEGRVKAFRGKEDMISWLVDKFPGKIDFNDPDMISAIVERFPDENERRGVVAQVFASGKSTGNPAKAISSASVRAPGDVKLRAKQSGKVFYASKEKAEAAVKTGLFEKI